MAKMCYCMFRYFFFHYKTFFKLWLTKLSLPTSKLSLCSHTAHTAPQPHFKLKSSDLKWPKCVTPCLFFPQLQSLLNYNHGVYTLWIMFMCHFIICNVSSDKSWTFRCGFKRTKTELWDRGGPVGRRKNTQSLAKQLHSKHDITDLLV